MYQSVHSISSTVIVAAAMIFISDIRNRQVGSLGLLWPWNGDRLKNSKKIAFCAIWPLFSYPTTYESHLNPKYTQESCKSSNVQTADKETPACRRFHTDTAVIRNMIYCRDDGRRNHQFYGNSYRYIALLSSPTEDSAFHFARSVDSLKNS